jgi:hypothetical protein
LLVEEDEPAALNFQRKYFEIVQQDQVRDPNPTNRASRCAVECSQCPSWVKMQNARCEQMFSALPPTSDIESCRLPQLIRPYSVESELVEKFAERFPPAIIVRQARAETAVDGLEEFALAKLA